MKRIYFDIKPGEEALLKDLLKENSYYVILEPDHGVFCDLLRKYGQASNIPDGLKGKVFPVINSGPRNESYDNYRPKYDQELEISLNQVSLHGYIGS